MDVLRTERLELRRPVIGDIAEVYAVHADPETSRHHPSGPDADEQASRVRLQGWIADWRERGIGYWTVRARPLQEAVETPAARAGESGTPARARATAARRTTEDARGIGEHPGSRDRMLSGRGEEAAPGAGGEVLGFGGLRFHELEGEEVLNLYYRFRPSAWGRGYAPEMAAAALAVGRERFPGVPIVAIIRDSNLPSLKVAERIGMRHDRTITYVGTNSHVFLLGSS
ncbi:GNAT family N-acetyltransferase [Microtetraspora fusca]|uniref:GNAT family N-acetyltransferase n=1 Tax=Microtetraspora fusca TaxID=1997 RepID=A0ABW6V675_MICFU